ncbi:MAG: ketoacyl-ACP synthase III [Ardenticatenaceae bacterium]|nr:ketoacyl-ACP synthase III [Ardenticatenaceae bacterium]
MGRYATIAGTGRYVPERVLTNADLDEMLGEPVGEWLVENVGIEERHVMADTETTSDMAVVASRQALARAGISAAELDLIIVATDTPDYISPATASVVQAKLGARDAGTYDINCACAAWVTGLDAAGKYIATDSDYDHILLVGAYGMTRFVDWTDKYTCTLFADGAGAVVLKAGDEPGVLAGGLLASGEYHNALGIYTGGTSLPATLEVIRAQGKPRVQFVRKFPATFNTEHWPPLVRKVLAKAGLGLDDVALFLFTQLNLRTIEATMATLDQPMSKTHWIMDKWGYTGSACIPMALDDALEQRKLQRGDYVVFCASGGGLAMAAAVARWTLG